jgi:hypothetical protein
MLYQTDQENFWAGDFGTEYVSRNQSEQLFASNVAMFSHALRLAYPLSSCLEFGANVGMNLRALRVLHQLRCVRTLFKLLCTKHLFSILQ